jgi:hypothetical protein
MNDDLRDYRFYKADMIHPTEQAEEYIWQRFSTSYMSEHTLEFLKEWKEIKNALSHKPFHPHSHGHQIFLKQTIQRLEQLKNIVNVDVEMKALKSQLGIDSHNPLAHDH